MARGRWRAALEAVAESCECSRLMSPSRTSQDPLTTGFWRSPVIGRPWWETGRQEEGTSQSISPLPLSSSGHFIAASHQDSPSLQGPRPGPPWLNSFHVLGVPPAQRYYRRGFLFLVASHPMFVSTQQNPCVNMPCLNRLTLFH